MDGSSNGGLIQGPGPGVSLFGLAVPEHRGGLLIYQICVACLGLTQVGSTADQKARCFLISGKVKYVGENRSLIIALCFPASASGGNAVEGYLKSTGNMYP